jgi:hypothetical protein
VLPKNLRPTYFHELTEGAVFFQNCGCKWKAGRLVQDPLHLEAALVKNCYLHRNRNEKARILGRTPLWVSVQRVAPRRALVQRLLRASTA